jgi:hypothetical protein
MPRGAQQPRWFRWNQPESRWSLLHLLTGDEAVQLVFVRCDPAICN